MDFLFPSFLFGLLALAIPIIIHLFHFRRFKKVYFTNVRFLKEVKEETSARSKIKNLLILLMRCLAVAFLVFAFAQPFIPQGTDVQKGEKSVSVFVDNSFSMSSLSEDVPLLELAKRRATEIVSAYAPDDRFQILTNDFEGRHQRLVSKEDALNLIEEVKISPSVRELSNVMTRQRQALETGTSDNNVSYLISDFQKNITDFQSYSDTSVLVNFVPLQSVQEKNISIDSAYFDAPVQMLNQTNPLIVKVTNRSNEAAENIRLSLRHEGQVKPVGTLSIPANSSVTDTVNITILKTGIHEAVLEITDYPVQFDDKYYFTFNVAEEINVLVINESSQNKFLQSALKGIPYFKTANQNSKSLDYASFAAQEMIIMNDLTNISSGLSFELNKFVEAGGNLLVFPASNANTASYNSFLATFPANDLQTYDASPRTVGDINRQEFIFADVFEGRRSNMKLPVTQGNWKMSSFGSRREEKLLTYRDGTSYLGKYKIGSGHLYLSSAPLDTKINDLVRNGEIFVPLLYKSAISSAKEQKIAYTIGQDEVLQTEASNSAETVYKLKGRREEFIPQQRSVGSQAYLTVNNEIKEAGYFDLFLQAGTVLDKFGFNYNRKESQLGFFNEDALTEMSEKSPAGAKMNIISSTQNANFEELIGERSQGIVLWRWCLIAALLFLLIETLLLRFWKK